MNAPLADAVPARRQHSFVFEVTQSCNHDCLHCYNAWKNAAPYPMGELGTADTLVMLGKMLDETGAALVSLTGGEPMLRRDIYEIVSFIRARKVEVNLITNGSLLDAEAIRRMLREQVSVFELPLLSSDREIHDRMSGSPGAFDRATLAMAEIKAAGGRAVGVFVATKLNLHTWRETAELAVALGLDGVMFNRFNPGGCGLRNLPLLQAAPGAIQSALDTAEEISERYSLPMSCSIAMPPCLFDTAGYKRLTFGFCAAGTPRAYYTLDPMGNVRPCNHSPQILGNIRERGFWDMVDGDGMKEFMAARPAFCKGCQVEEQCQGGCKAAAQACCGSAWEPDPFLAAFMAKAAKPGVTRAQASSPHPPPR